MAAIPVGSGTPSSARIPIVAVEGTGRISVDKTATITLGSNPKILVGDSFTVSGVIPTAYNGKFTATAVSSTAPFTVSYSSRAIGEMTEAGVFTKSSYAQVINVFGASTAVNAISGKVYATLSLAAAPNVSVGQRVAVTGITPVGYNSDPNSGWRVESSSETGPFSATFEVPAVLAAAGGGGTFRIHRESWDVGDWGTVAASVGSIGERDQPFVMGVLQGQFMDNSIWLDVLEGLWEGLDRALGLPMAIIKKIVEIFILGPLDGFFDVIACIFGLPEPDIDTIDGLLKTLGDAGNLLFGNIGSIGQFLVNNPLAQCLGDLVEDSGNFLQNFVEGIFSLLGGLWDFLLNNPLAQCIAAFAEDTGNFLMNAVKGLFAMLEMAWAMLMENPLIVCLMEWFEDIFGAVDQAILGVLGGINHLFNQLKNIFDRPILQSLRDIFGGDTGLGLLNIIEGAVEAFTSFVNLIGFPNLGEVIEFLQEAVDNVWGFFTGGVIGVPKTLNDVVDGLLGWLEDGGVFVAKVFEKLVEWFTTPPAELLAALLELVRGWLTGGGEIIGDIIEGLLGAFDGALDFVGNLLKSLFGGGFDGALDFIGNLFKSLFGGSFDSALGFVPNLIKSLFGAFDGALDFLGNLLKSLFGNSFDAALDFIGNLLRSIPLVRAITGIGEGDGWQLGDGIEFLGDWVRDNFLTPFKPLPIANVTQGTVNILGSGTFEDVTTVSATDGWAWDGTQSATAGGGSARIVLNGFNKQLTYRDPVAVTAGTRLRMTCQMKTTDVTGTGWKATISVVPYVGPAQSTITQLGFRGSATASWTEIGGDYTVPAGVTSLAVRVGVELGTAGTVWFDNIRCYNNGVIPQRGVDQLVNTWEGVWDGVFGSGGFGKIWSDAVTAVSNVNVRTNLADTRRRTLNSTLFGNEEGGSQVQENSVVLTGVNERVTRTNNNVFGTAFPAINTQVPENRVVLSGVNGRVDRTNNNLFGKAIPAVGEKVAESSVVLTGINGRVTNTNRGIFNGFFGGNSATGTDVEVTTTMAAIKSKLDGGWELETINASQTWYRSTAWDAANPPSEFWVICCGSGSGGGKGQASLNGSDGGKGGQGGRWLAKQVDAATVTPTVWASIAPASAGQAGGFGKDAPNNFGDTSFGSYCATNSSITASIAGFVSYSSAADARGGRGGDGGDESGGPKVGFAGDASPIAAGGVGGGITQVGGVGGTANLLGDTRAGGGGGGGGGGAGFGQVPGKGGAGGWPGGGGGGGGAAWTAAGGDGGHGGNGAAGAVILLWKA